MSINTKLTYICSFCGDRIHFNIAQQNKRAKCPKCKAIVRLLDNCRADIRPFLSSQWMVKVPKKLILSETLGPMSEMDFVKMFEMGQLSQRCEVKSDRYTHGHWSIFNPVLMPAVTEEARQKCAEGQRLSRIEEQKRKIDCENQRRLRKFVQQAISDGQISSKEDSAIVSFAAKARLDLADVRALIRDESEQVVQAILVDALEDGILAPDEEAKLKHFYTGLGVSMNPTQDQSKVIVLSRLAYDLNMREGEEHAEIDAPFSLQNNERCLGFNCLEWNEIVQLKRPKGISLGNDRYLRRIAVGNCYITSKRLLLESEFDSKKATISSIQRVDCFRDGIFINRSIGKSLFLKFLAIDDLEHLKFSLTMKRILVNDFIQGFLPTENYIPEQILDAKIVKPIGSRQLKSKQDRKVQDASEPRFTFRVVGDHIGDRSYWIRKLGPGEPLTFVREPDNHYDSDAVLICNRSGKQLGYLKQEVVAWFAPLLDRGKRFSVSVFRIRQDGCLIIGVYE